MNDFSHHLFREIYGQPELWLSIGSRADEIGAVLEQARAIGPNLVHVTGRGSSAHAASIIGRHAEEVLNVPSRFFRSKMQAGGKPNQAIALCSHSPGVLPL